MGKSELNRAERESVLSENFRSKYTLLTWVKSDRSDHDKHPNRVSNKILFDFAFDIDTTQNTRILTICIIFQKSYHFMFVFNGNPTFLEYLRSLL